MVATTLESSYNMTGNHEELWDLCRKIIKTEIGATQYSYWFKDITSISFNDGVLRLFVPSDMFVEYLEGKFLPVMAYAIREVYGAGVNLKYTYNVKAGDPASIVNVASAKNNPELSTRDMDVSSLSEETKTRKVEFDPNLNPAYTLENYCVSDSNRLAFSIAESIADNPAVKTFNPLFIFGSTGVGKTHLIQGIGHRIIQNRPNARVFYVSARTFESQYTTAIFKSQTNKFFNYYQSVDTLIVDDIQDLQGKEKTQNTFFNIFNHLHLNGRQIVFSSDRSPAEMEGFEAHLLGRFKWGMTVALEKPDHDLRLSILRQKAAQAGIELPDDVMNYIVDNVTDSIRELEGIMVSLVTRATVMNMPINMNLTREVVANAVKINRRQLNFEIIADVVSTYFDIQPDTLFTSSRKREISDARQIVMYLAKKHMNMPLTGIGHRLGRTHATVLYGIRNIEERMLIERALQDDIRNIEDKLTL